MQPPADLTDGVVVLRQLAEDDRAAVLRTMGDPLVREWLNMPAEPCDGDFALLRRTVRQGRSRGERYDWCVVEAGEDEVFGAVVASRRARENFELAYLAREAGRGRGLMTRAVTLACDWLFTHGVGRIEVRTHPANDRSRRLAERCGFVPEGRERSSIWLHGRREDADVWSLLPSDRARLTTIPPCRTGC